MHIGIVPFYDPKSGGGHQYTETVIDQILRGEDDLADYRFALYLRSIDRRHAPNLDGHPRWSARRIPPGLRAQLIDWGKGHLRHSALGPLAKRLAPRRLLKSQVVSANPDFVIDRPDYRGLFRRGGVDWILFTTSHSLGFEAGIPFCMPVHDLQHRLHPEFPELSADGEWSYREYVYRNAAAKAEMLFVDSEVGKEDLLNCYSAYGMTEDRITVLPFLPAHYLQVDVDDAARSAVRQAYNLPARYFFCPAQFWPHKNHHRLVQAVGLLKQRGLEVHLVLSGSRSGRIRTETYEETMTSAARLGVSGQIRSLGYVPNEHMSALYAEAVALAFPTFLGPTNIPVLEAWAFGCPVLTSDVRGVREQAGDAALLVDPASVEAIAHGLEMLWEDSDRCRALSRKGQARLAAYGPAEFRRRLFSAMRTVSARISG